jgi:hypothetical protein
VCTVGFDHILLALSQHVVSAAILGVPQAASTLLNKPTSVTVFYHL